MQFDGINVGICTTIDCGPTGVCIERSFFEGLYYACGCTNGTQNYLNPGPCPSISNRRYSRVRERETFFTDANPATTTLPPIVFCNNGGRLRKQIGMS